MMADALVSASYKILLSTSSGTSVSIYSVKSGQSYGLLVLVYSDTDHFYPIYSTAPFTFNGITFNGG
ncbi:MAG: hypothetical protein J6W64_00030 [Bacilli bacterium]|nr:hypothetical protein [Bacilli bacterium]